MDRIKEIYFKLTRPQLLALAATLVVIECAIMYFYMISPALAARDQLRDKVERTKGTIELHEKKIAESRDLYNVKDQLEPDKLNELRQNGNAIPSVMDIPDVLEQIRQIAVDAGGKDVEIQEGESEQAYLKLGKTDLVYKIKKMPVYVLFESGYSGASSFIFNIDEMNMTIAFTEIGLHAPEDDYTGKIIVDIELDLYYSEDTGEL